MSRKRHRRISSLTRLPLEGGSMIHVVYSAVVGRLSLVYRSPLSSSRQTYRCVIAVLYSLINPEV